MANHHEARLREHFGDGSVEQLKRLVKLQHGAGHPDSSLDEVLPLGASSLLAGVLLAGSDTKYCGLESAAASTMSLLRGNVSSAVKSLKWPAGSGRRRWTSEQAVACGERLLQVPESAFKLITPPDGSDHAALRFLAEAVRQNKSPAEMVRALQEDPEGQRCLDTFHSSPTFGAVLLLASWWDDVLDWLEGAVQWVKDAVAVFGDWATKQANALVENVFSRYEGLTHVLEEVPGVGLAVAGIYYLAGDHDHALAAFAININAIVTVAATSLAFAVGGPAAAMAGGAAGKFAGLEIQIWLSHYIHDPKLRAEVGDISTTRFVIDVALAGAVYGGAVGIGKTLATSLGWSFLQKLGASLTLAGLLSELPNALT